MMSGEAEDIRTVRSYLEVHPIGDAAFERLLEHWRWDGKLPQNISSRDADIRGSVIPVKVYNPVLAETYGGYPLVDAPVRVEPGKWYYVVLNTNEGWARIYGADEIQGYLDAAGP